MTEEGGGIAGCKNAANYCLKCVAVGFPWVKWCTWRKAALYLCETEGIEEEVTETWEHAKKMYKQKQMNNKAHPGLRAQLFDGESAAPVNPRKRAAAPEEPDAGEGGTAGEEAATGIEVTGVEVEEAPTGKGRGKSRKGKPRKGGVPPKDPLDNPGQPGDPPLKKAKKEPTLAAKSMAAAKLTKMSSSAAKVSAQSIITQIGRDDPGWSFAKSMTKPMTDALKQLDALDADHEVFPSIVSANDLTELRSEWIKKKKVDQFDRYLAEFSEKYDPVVRGLQLEARMLTSQKQARDQEIERAAQGAGPLSKKPR